MIFFKNQGGQVAFTRLINAATGAGVDYAITGNSDIVAFIAQDGGALTATTNSVTRILDTSNGAFTNSSKYYGVYGVILTQAETNCNNGVIVFMEGNPNRAWPANTLAQTVYFTTSEFTPLVGIANGTYNFSTTGGVGTVGSVTTPTSIITELQNSIVDSNVDGSNITMTQLNKLLLAFMCGKVVITHNLQNSTATLDYYGRNNAKVLSITVAEADGARSTQGTFT